MQRLILSPVAYRPWHLICHKRIVAFFVILVFPLSGCGYHFSGEGPGPRPGLRRIAIPLFENNTGEVGLEEIFASDLRTEFINRGSMEVVPVDQAEAILKGAIIKIFTTPVAHREVEKTIETRLYVTLDIRCEDAQDKSILWQDNQLTYFEEYFQSDDAIVSFDHRREAMELISKEIAVRVHDRFLSNF